MWKSLPPIAREYIYEQDIPLKIARIDETFNLPEREIRVAGIAQRDNEMLFIQSSREGRHWEFPGGRLEPDESPESAIQREFTEETGFEVLSSEPLLALVWAFQDSTIVQLVFHVTPGDKIGTPDETEVSDINWFNELPDEISFGDAGEETYRVIIDSSPVTIDFEENSHPFNISVPDKKSLAVGGAVAGSAVAAGLARKLLNKHEQ